MKKKQQEIKLLIILILILLTVFSFVVTFGRYVSNSINNFFLKSKEFYFNADKLSEDTAIFQIDNWSGVDDYTIIVNMNSRDNNIKKTSYDINYNISYVCSNSIVCQLSKTSGTIYSSTNSDSFNIVISPNQQFSDGDVVEVYIEATSTTNYEKTLKGKFSLVVGVEELTYEVTDEVNSNYLDLSFTNTVSYYIAKQNYGSYNAGDKINSDTYSALTDEGKSYFYSAKATVTFNPRTVVLDMTTENYSNFTNITTTTIDGIEYINGFTVDIDALSSINIRFYKSDITQDYSFSNESGQTNIFSITSI